METIFRLKSLLHKVCHDGRMQAIHVSLYTALCNIWLASQCSCGFSISRKKVMELAKIRSIATYHRVMDRLVKCQYIAYEPSYHPRLGSKVTLL